MIQIYEPLIATNQKKYVNQCLDNNELTFHGQFIKKFEDCLSYNYQSKAVAMANGSVSLFTILKNLPEKNKNKKYVITSTLTYVATVSQIILAGYTPILIDCKDDLQMSEKHLCKTISSCYYDVAAVIVPELYADSADLSLIRDICDNHNIFMIEDSAESLFCWYNPQKLCGTYGDASSFSFFANKIITCGEGGAIITKNKELEEKYRLFINQGNIGNYKHVGPSSNFRMTNMQAAIGCAQLEDINFILNRKTEIAFYYRVNLKCESIVPSINYSSEWMPVFKLPKNKKYEDLFNYLNFNKIDCRPTFYPIHLLDGFKKHVILSLPGLSESEKTVGRYFILPCYPSLTNEQLEYIVRKTNNFL